MELWQLCSRLRSWQGPFAKQVGPQLRALVVFMPPAIRYGARVLIHGIGTWACQSSICVSVTCNNDDNNNFYAFYVELGMCRTSLVSPEQPP